MPSGLLVIVETKLVSPLSIILAVQICKKFVFGFTELRGALCRNV